MSKKHRHTQKEEQANWLEKSNTVDQEAVRQEAEPSEKEASEILDNKEEKNELDEMPEDTMIIENIGEQAHHLDHLDKELHNYEKSQSLKNIGVTIFMIIIFSFILALISFLFQENTKLNNQLELIADTLENMKSEPTKQEKNAALKTENLEAKITELFQNSEQLTAQNTQLQGELKNLQETLADTKDLSQENNKALVSALQTKFQAKNTVQEGAGNAEKFKADMDQQFQNMNVEIGALKKKIENLDGQKPVVVQPVETATVRFDTCGTTEKYQSYWWYPKFLDKAVLLPRFNEFDPSFETDSRNLIETDIAQMCYSDNGKMALALVPATDGMNGFQILKYDLDRNMIYPAAREDVHGNQNSNWYRAHIASLTETQKQNIAHYVWSPTPEQFGKRHGDWIYLYGSAISENGLEEALTFRYDFENNDIWIEKRCLKEIDISEEKVVSCEEY